MTHVPVDTLELQAELLLAQLPPDTKRLVVGYSGGLDSSVLLELTVQAARKRGTGLLAVHVNHQIQDLADEWEAFCVSRCRNLGVDLVTRRVDVSRSGSMEASARRERYAVFHSVCDAGDVLLLAHHFDDQVETWLFRTLRGDAVRLMPVVRPLGKAQLLRPLLGVWRASLRRFAVSHELAWIEDPSNEDRAPDRNFLRHEIVAPLASRDPQFQQKIAAAMARDAELSELAAALGEQDCRQLMVGETITLSGLAALSPARQVNALRSWLHLGGFEQPTRGSLNELRRQIAGDGNVVLETDQVVIRGYDGSLHACRLHERYVLTSVTWQGQEELELPGGRLLARVVVGEGVARSPLLVRYRQAGDCIRLAGNRPRLALSRLFQARRVPPWRRDEMPVLAGPTGELVAVAGLNDAGVTAAAHVVGPDEQGHVFSWVPDQGC